MKLNRTWLFQRSRDVALLWKCSLAIVGAGILLAALMLAASPSRGSGDFQSRLVVAINRLRQVTEVEYKKLADAREPRPADLANWIRRLPAVMKNNPKLGEFDGKHLRLEKFDVQPLLEKHLADPGQRDLFAQFSRAWVLDPGAAQEDAVRQVHEIAAREPSMRFAGEFEGDLFLRDNRRPEALHAYMREISAESAERPRHEAFVLALELHDKDSLRTLCDDPRCLREVDPYWFGEAGRLLGDRWLVMRSVVQTQWERWSQSVAVPLALFAAAVWYLILVSSASRERFRWLRYLSPVFAGVLSVWLLEWLQSYIGYNPSYKGGDKSGVQELIYTILYVGVPEEGVKLAFFALFVPILLRYDSRVKAALTAGCVGLGFAMDENMLYFDNEGVAVAVGRLMTANFMHIALTGLTGLWFYRMIRSRFHQAGEFVVMFVGMAVAHGVYDFATTMAAMEWGVDFAGILILFGLAKLYLHELRPRDASGHRALISSTSILFLGLSFVMAVAIVVAVWQTNQFAVVADVLKETLGIIPVTVLFVREFREV